VNSTLLALRKGQGDEIEDLSGDSLAFMLETNPEI